MAALSSQGMSKLTGLAYWRDVVLVEVPVVDVDLEPVVIGQAVALEGLEDGSRRHREGGLDARLLGVVGEVEGLGDGVHRVGHGDGLAVMPDRSRCSRSSRR